MKGAKMKAALEKRRKAHGEVSPARKAPGSMKGRKK